MSALCSNILTVCIRADHLSSDLALDFAVKWNRLDEVKKILAQRLVKSFPSAVQIAFELRRTEILWFLTSLPAWSVRDVNLAPLYKHKDLYHHFQGFRPPNSISLPPCLRLVPHAIPSPTPHQVMSNFRRPSQANTRISTPRTQSARSRHMHPWLRSSFTSRRLMRPCSSSPGAASSPSPLTSFSGPRKLGTSAWGLAPWSAIRSSRAR